MGLCFACLYPREREKLLRMNIDEFLELISLSVNNSYSVSFLDKNVIFRQREKRRKKRSNGPGPIFRSRLKRIYNDTYFYSIFFESLLLRRKFENYTIHRFTKRRSFSLLCLYSCNWNNPSKAVGVVSRSRFLG